MPFKFQFQFAGADFSRPSSPYRKWLRVGAIAMMSLLTALAYWGYLHHLTHRHLPMLAHAAPAAAKVVAPVAVKPVTPVVAPAVPKVESKTVVAAGGQLVESAKVSTAVPMAAPVVRVPLVPVVAAATVVAAAPVVFHPYRVRTDGERLVMAGQTAFANVIETAGKYPDAYGFQAGDFLSDAKLGAPMPVYTIDESARAGYQKGQPVKPLLKPAKQWVFPVLMGDRVCCMVEVSQSGKDYVPGKGNKSLAMAWGKIQEKWSAEEGYHPMLLVNPEVPGYYFTVPELPVQNITDTTEMFFYHPGTSPADVILASWR